MDNPLQKYIGQELKDSIESVKVLSQTSKEGTVYYYIGVKFINTYTYRIYPFKEELLFAFANAFDLLNSQKQIENNF